MSIPLVYIAGRFRGAKNADVQRNIDIAAQFRAPIAEIGAMPVCVHIGEGLAMHDIQQQDNGAWWLESTLEVLRRCDAIVAVPGWRESAGSYGEVAEALRLQKFVFEAPWDGTALMKMGIPQPAPPAEWRQITALKGRPKAAQVEFVPAAIYNFEMWVNSYLKRNGDV